MITVVTPASSYLLTTRALAQAQLGLTGVDDTLFDELVASASSWITNYLAHGRVAKEDVIETVKGYDDSYLMLSRTPIVSVASVSRFGGLVTDFVIEDANAGILFRESGWDMELGWSRGVAPHPLPRTEVPIYTVTYTGGWTLPSFVPLVTVTLPAEIQQACNRLVAVWYKTVKDNVAPGTSSIKVGDYQISYREDSADNSFDDVATRGVPLDIVAALRPWRRFS